MGLRVTVQVDTTVPSGGRIRIVNQSVTGPAGVGVPAGGTTGQVLTKDSSTNYDTSWTTPSSGAPVGAQYVTLAADGTLTSERVLTAGTGITVTDGGAGAAVTVATSAILPTIVDAKGDLIVGTAADTVARLAAGINNQALVADSSATGGVKWAANNPAAGSAWWTGYQVNEYATATITAAAITVGNAVAQNFIHYVPIWIAKTTTFDSIGTYYAAAVGGRLRLGIYDATGTNGLPGSLVVDSGELTYDIAGNKTATINVTLTGGLWYWLCSTHNVAVNVALVPQTVAPSWNIDSNFATGFQYASVTQSRSYAALPATATPVRDRSSRPVIGIRAT